MTRERDSRLVKASFDVWLSRSMIFNNPPGMNLKTYKKYTKTKKVKYTRKIEMYLDKMENNWFKCEHENRTAVAIKLDGIIRYVWREDLLSEKEYDEIRKKHQDGLRILCKNTRGNVG